MDTWSEVDGPQLEHGKRMNVLDTPALKLSAAANRTAPMTSADPAGSVRTSGRSCRICRSCLGVTKWLPREVRTRATSCGARPPNNTSEYRFLVILQGSIPITRINYIPIE